MRTTRLALRGIAAQNAAWMNREHNRLDARLASAFLQTVWGSAREARKEFDAYRKDLAAHLKEGERRFFTAIASLDEPTQAMEHLEWRAHTRDLRQAFVSIQRELRTPTIRRYEAFGTLRRAMRRHQRHKHHLLQLVGAAEAVAFL